MIHAAVFAVLVAAAPAGPAAAQEAEVEEGFSLFQEGTRMLLRGLAAEMAPIFEQLQTLIDEVDNYEAPERLPNGDIIIRRKTPLPADPDAPEIDI